MPETCFRGAAEALIDTRIVVVQVCESSTVDLLKTIGRMLAQQGELGRVLDEAGQERLRLRLMAAILDVVAPTPRA
ncbi:hypothetical protein MSIMFB_01707 [Mycobacterium simulans]|uniref:Uncharacterized protein n=1 Tax=Mycobacterium simulans TaxID=627089 RepID=A0A7Z7IIP7_9MYCO|nr:hypothetical protein [Mycobacterium simulans]SOJ54208.1 hypothetical protein MSIMFB_01707 [Mycobacterium simulans]